MRDHERRAAERPEARQSRLERLRQRNCEQRAAEQADARQARLARNREANRRRRQAERQPEPQQTNVPALEEDWVQSKLTAFHQAYPLLIVSPATSHSLASSSPPVPLCVAAVHVTRKQEPKLYSAANNMDPGSVPLALQGLTQDEKMLILL